MVPLSGWYNDRLQAEWGGLKVPRQPSLSPRRTMLCCAQRLVCRCLCRLGRDRRWLEAFDDQPDAQPQLPDELRADHDAPHHRAWLEDPEQDADETSEQHRPGDQP